MASVLSSPTPSLPTNSVPIVTPPLLGSPELSPDDASTHDTPALDPPSCSPTPPSAASESQPSTPTSTSALSHSHSHSSVVPAYPYNVTMVPASLNGGPMPDDSEVTTRLPSICVDYLSHDWAEDDVWTSWKAMTRHKSEIANGVRLENASWRTWAKQRGKLKTISPETLNWLKDSDVTWLYGPLHTAVEAVPPPKIAGAAERLGLEPLRSLSDAKRATEKKAETMQELPVQRKNGKKSEVKTKPILKYRSLSDILMPQGQPTSPVIEQLGMDFEDQATISVHHARSDSHLVRLNSLNRKKRSSPIHSPGSSSPERTASDSSSSATYFKKKERRHISFNHRVEQCIAIDSADEKKHYGSTASSSSSDDEDDVLTFGSSPRHPHFPNATSKDKEPHTIARLGPTTLKSVEMYPAPSPAVVYQNSPSDHDDSPLHQEQLGQPVATYSAKSGALDDQQAVGRRAMYDYSAGSSTRSQWDPEDEDDYAMGMGFDYFTGGGGPDVGVGDEYDMANYGSAAHLAGSAHTAYHGDTVSGSSSYLGSGPHSPISPYGPSKSTPDPTESASSVPYFRDSQPSSSSPSPAPAPSSRAQGAPTSTRGPYSPSTSSRDAVAPKRSAMKGARSREPSAESDISTSTSSPPLSASISPAGAVATAIPPHVRPGARRTNSDEGSPRPPERGRSASRGSSSSLERAASADRRTSTSIPPSSYSPPSASSAAAAAAAANTGAKPISIQASQRVGSYESFASVVSGASASGASRMPDLPEASPESEAGLLRPGNGSSRLGIVTSSSVDSFASLGSLGGPPTPTSPSAPSPRKRFQAMVPDDDDEDGEMRVEDVDAFPATIDDTEELRREEEEQTAKEKQDEGERKAQDEPERQAESAAPKAADRPPPVLVAPPSTAPPGPASSTLVSTPTDTLPLESPTPTAAPAASSSASPALGHGRTPSGPRLRNPSPSTPTTSTTAEEGHAEVVVDPSGSSADPSPAASAMDRSPSLDGPDGAPTTADDASSSSHKRQPSFARRSLLRAARGSSDQGRGDEATSNGQSRASVDGTSGAPVDADYGFGYDEDVGKGIDVAGTARDLLGAISKGIWGSLGRASR
ncbi:hypothetical protein JCM5296_005198 [Sporobolomyces johnsonii]